MSEASDLGHSLSLLECFTIHFHCETLLQAEDVKDDTEKDTASLRHGERRCVCRSIQIDVVGTRNEPPPPQLCRCCWVVQYYYSLFRTD